MCLVGSPFLFQVALALLKLNEKALLDCNSAAGVYSYLNGEMTHQGISIDGLIRESDGMRGMVKRAEVERRREEAVKRELADMAIGEEEERVEAGLVLEPVVEGVVKGLDAVVEGVVKEYAVENLAVVGSAEGTGDGVEEVGDGTRVEVNGVSEDGEAEGTPPVVAESVSGEKATVGRLQSEVSLSPIIEGKQESPALSPLSSPKSPGTITTTAISAV